MKSSQILARRMRPAQLIPFLPLLGSAAFGATIVAFEGAPTDTPFTLNQFGVAPGASVQTSGGNPGGYLQLTPGANDQNNWATFNRTDPVSNVVNFSFQFQICRRRDIGPQEPAGKTAVNALQSSIAAHIARVKAARPAHRASRHSLDAAIWARCPAEDREQSGE